MANKTGFRFSWTATGAIDRFRMMQALAKQTQRRPTIFVVMIGLFLGKLYKVLKVFEIRNLKEDYIPRLM